MCDGRNTFCFISIFPIWTNLYSRGKYKRINNSKIFTWILQGTIQTSFKCICVYILRQLEIAFNYTQNPLFLLKHKTSTIICHKLTFLHPQFSPACFHLTSFTYDDNKYINVCTENRSHFTREILIKPYILHFPKSHV